MSTIDVSVNRMSRESRAIANISTHISRHEMRSPCSS
jgi:hypothetical protein